MRCSVLIPTYNSAAVIRATLASVLEQKSQPDEIIVLDDGSTDDTVSILRTYEPRVTVLQQRNTGVAGARNALAARARGDLVAFLDHDDLWHPSYLEQQQRLSREFPTAVAFFAGHVNFQGHGVHSWDHAMIPGADRAELINPLDFLTRYNVTTGLFGSMSFCCLPRRVLQAMGPEPFQVSGVDDSYLCTRLPLFGPVVLNPAKLVAYRLTDTAQSASRLKSFGLWLTVFELLESSYQNLNDRRMQKAFCLAYAAKRRRYGKVLMSAGDRRAARRQFWAAAKDAGGFLSLAKSLAFLSSTRFPRALQPRWKPADRAAEKIVLVSN